MAPSGWKCYNFWDWKPSADAAGFDQTALDAITVTSEKPFQEGALATVASISLLEEVCAIGFFLVVFGSFFYVPVGIIAAFVALPLSWAVAVLVLVITAAVYPLKYHPALNHWAITSVFMKYCSYRIVFPEQLDLPNMGPVFGLVPPHGVFPLQNLLTHFVIPKCSGNYVRGMAADSLLAVPVIRHFVTWMGGVSATKENAVDSLQQGFISGVSPDGIAGIFEVNDPDEVLIILKRRGIYEIAIRAGVPLLCSYTFGATKAFSASWGGQGSILPKVSRMLRTSLFVFWGRFGLPIPRRVPITTVWGMPIPCKQMDKPGKEDAAAKAAMDKEIERLQAEVLKGYQDLFDTHKVAYGWKHKKLVLK